MPSDRSTAPLALRKAKDLPQLSISREETPPVSRHSKSLPPSLGSANVPDSPQHHLGEMVARAQRRGHLSPDAEIDSNRTGNRSRISETRPGWPATIRYFQGRNAMSSKAIA